MNIPKNIVVTKIDCSKYNDKRVSYSFLNKDNGKTSSFYRKQNSKKSEAELTAECIKLIV